MRGPRYTILGLMALTTFAAIGSLALVYATALWATALLSTAIALLAFGVLRAIYRPGPKRAFWVGFCTLGWGYLALAFWPGTDSVVTELRSHLMTTRLLELAWTGLETLPWENSAQEDFFVTGHALWTIALGCCGGWLARWLHQTRPVDA